jgi:hypothetical protein
VRGTTPNCSSGWCETISTPFTRKRNPTISALATTAWANPGWRFGGIGWGQSAVLAGDLANGNLTKKRFRELLKTYCAALRLGGDSGTRIAVGTMDRRTGR